MVVAMALSPSIDLVRINVYIEKKGSQDLEGGLDMGTDPVLLPIAMCIRIYRIYSIYIYRI